MNNGSVRFESHRERRQEFLTSEEELPVQQPLQSPIDYAVMEQINEFSNKTKTLPIYVINDVLRLWLDAEGAAKLVALGLEPLIPRFDGTAGHSSSLPAAR